MYVTWSTANRISRYGLIEYQSQTFGKLSEKQEVDLAHNIIISIVSTVYHQIPFAALFLNLEYH
jgi:hypothetical protein